MGGLCWPMSFEHPQGFIKVSGEVGQQIYGVGIAALGGGIDGGTHEVGEEGEAVFELGKVGVCRIKFGEARCTGGIADGALGVAADCDQTLSEVVNTFGGDGGEGIKELVHPHEAWTFDIPVGLLTL